MGKHAERDSVFKYCYTYTEKKALPHIARCGMITLGYGANIVFSQIKCCLSVCLFICHLLGEEKMADMCN